MPVKIPSSLPARKILEQEGVQIIKEKDAIRQDIRPLKIAILNLMPEKIKTETQLARMLSGTPLQVEITLLALTTHIPKTTPRQHLLDFYHPWSEVKDEKFDGLIITGAPIERLPFEGVSYWNELCKILDWSQSHVHGSFNLCWGAQATLYHFYGIQKYDLDTKAFGVFEHRVVNARSFLMRGLNDELRVPVSRHTENRCADFEPFENLEILIESDETGPCLVYDHALNHVQMFNHLEYDSTTLSDEYQRDLTRGEAIEVPAHYFPGDDPAATPVNRWRSNGHILYNNWINLIYQRTPYQLDRIGFNRGD